jgi:hypothetical protein
VLGDVYEERGDRVFVGGSKYRIPALEEAEEHLVDVDAIGCWSEEGDLFVTTGFELALFLTWIENLSSSLNPTSNQIADYIIVLAREHGITHVSISTSRKIYAFKLTLACSRAISFIYNFSSNYIYSSIFTSSFNYGRDSDLAFANSSSPGSFSTIPYYDLSRQFDHARELVTNRSQEDDGLEKSCIHLFLFIACWNLLAERSQENSKKTFLDFVKDIIQVARTHRRQDSVFVRECKKNRDIAFALYIHFVLISERRTGKLPAWEGIRIVREQISK